MNTRLFIYTLLVFSLSLFGIRSSYSNGLSGLSPEDQEKVRNHQQVAIYTDIPNEVWPKAEVYQYINALPHEAAAVFADYQNHCLDIAGIGKLIPDCVSNHAVTPDPSKLTQTEVTYTVALPWPINSETYTVIDTLTHDGAESSYQISWVLKEETENTAQSIGNVHFEPLASGTLMVYTTFVSPKSSWASWFLYLAKQKIVEAVSSIAEHVEKEKTQSPILFQSQLDRLELILKN